MLKIDENKGLLVTTDYIASELIRLVVMTRYLERLQKQEVLLLSPNRGCRTSFTSEQNQRKKQKCPIDKIEKLIFDTSYEIDKKVVIQLAACEYIRQGIPYFYNRTNGVLEKVFWRA
ncbi:hypothetical protein KB553_09295 [Chryseobacterium rhizoplanae]|uniref:hypothetical protein n=1 Tax=Chryseobacterium rhizoplanae TaxID=1609531 RepID=UPI001CE31A03|nr:hypothetical protein [Chryseobacterium rhizoplanae]UCA61712.1 hypothetical protein KB553_09295 [Chryseobacterium rhizoplanae]